MSTPRNRICPCGSRQKFKHCCGAVSEFAVRPTNEKLQELACEADNEGLLLGEAPNQRAFINVLRMLKRLGIEDVALTGAQAPDIVKRIFQTNDRLFRLSDQREVGVHLGFFMFRDLFCRFHVPMIYGSPWVDFWMLLDLSEDQKRWMATDEEAMARFEDQAIDLFDFGYGFMEFGRTREVTDQSKGLIYRAHVQLEAAAATATGAYDYRGTLQNALLGAELALKAGLSCVGYNDSDLRLKIGHDLLKAASALGACETAFDADRVIRAVRTFPNLVQSRYGGPQPDRREMGHILMKAQFIASEVTRTFTDRNKRAAEIGSKPRSFPS